MRWWILMACVACSGGDSGDDTTKDADTAADADTDADADSDTDADTDADADADTDSWVAFPTETVDTLEANMERYFAEQASPGAAVALVDLDTQELWAGTIGDADLAGTPWELDAPYPIGSVSKVFTTTIVMQLVEEGVWNLDDPMDLWVTSPWGGEGITLRDLIQHTSGIASYNYVGNFDGSQVYEPQDLIDWAELHGEDLLFPPGSTHEYSNTNYILLGLAIEATTGRPFETELQERILDPVGLDETYMAFEIPPDMVRGYQDDPLIDGTDLGHPTMGWTAGGMISTPTELAEFGAALFTYQLLTPSSLDEMTTPLLIDGAEVGHGMGLFGNNDVEYGGYWGHTGGIGGHLTYMFVLEDYQSVAVAMVNSFEGTDVDDMANAAWEVVLW